MSLSDPLLKQLKALVLKFRTSSGIVNDGQENLVHFCGILEKIFRKGLKSNGRWFGKTDYWSWLSKLSDVQHNQRINPIFNMIISSVKESRKVISLQGKGRLFIRYALVKKILIIPIEYLIKNRDVSETWYETEDSILGNEILSEILISLLFEVTEINFLLCLKNASFLDETWEMPVYKEYELVPCEDLGLTVKYLSHSTLVVHVEPGSVAEEDDKIAAGDVLDYIFGESLKGVKKSKVQQMMHQNRGWPVSIGIIKCHMSDGKVFPPIRELLVQSEMSDEQLVAINKQGEEKRKKTRMPPNALLPDEEKTEIPVHGPEEMATYSVLFIGEVSLGSDGRVDRIEEGIAAALSSFTGTKQPLFLQLGETEVVALTEDRKIVQQHCYTEISACGRRTDALLNFAYIAGETTCSLARNFKCFVYEASTNEEAKIILYAIGQGFGRTNWYV